MHQTFYIDIDEEITSIVDRLRKARANEVIIVVPKRALLIQSIVNLKLLKKEAESLGKQIAIVTQDKLGKMLVEKTGILVQQKLDDSEGEEMIPLDASLKKTALEDMAAYENEGKIDSKNRIEAMGSAEYFEESPKKENIKINIKTEESQRGRKVKDESIHKEEEKDAKEEVFVSVSADKRKKIKPARKAGPFDIMPIKNETARPGEGESKLYDRERFEDLSRGEKAENFFQDERLERYKSKAKSRDYGDVNLSGKLWKYFAGLIGFGLLAGLLAAAYLFLPKADIKIFVKSKNQTADAQIKGDVSVTAVGSDAQTIPAKILSVDGENTISYATSGNKSSANQKARGTITIFNEYSGSPQPLVATTRFESSDGKIFRLIKAVIVPGISNAGGETKPGAIEAEVIADEAGEAYNIEPTTFTIPGFKDSGSEKYAKFYAKSFKAMAGGGSGGSMAKSVSAADIASAKNQALDGLKQQINEKLKESAGAGEIILDDAVDFGEVIYAVSGSVDEIADNFTVTAKTTAKAFAFSEDDLRNSAKQIFTKNGVAAPQIDEKSLSFQFGKSDTDFAKGLIVIRANLSLKTNPQIDLENLKKGILGKSEDDFKAYLKSYPDLEKVEINYWPSFLTGKIPAYASRVNISLDNN